MDRSRSPRAPRPAGPVPDRAALHEAALRHLERYAATESGLVRVLDRRIARWLRASGAEAEQAATARAAAREVARALVSSGVVDDAVFAEARARRLLRSGRSGRAVLAHLSAKGVRSDLAGQMLPDPGQELGAALAFARRRRLGPFRTGEVAEDGGQKELATMARAGFPRDVAERALAIEPDEAAAIVARLKQGLAQD
ncbi:MAG: regulatory protein RecX [Acetobacteraceae bacterium]